MTNDSNLKQLTGKRSSIKSHLTIFERFLNAINVDNLSQVYLELNTRLENLIEKHKGFDNIQSDIELIEEHSEDQFDIREEFENRFFMLRAKAKEYLISYEQSVIPDSKPSVIITNKPDISSIKLPAIELPVFDGDYLNWRSFEDSFVAFVDKNESLSNVQKLCYLRSQLKGDAWELIKSLDTTSDNYQIAFDLVKDRYNNHRRIVYSHVNALLNIKFENPKSFINIVDQHIRSLEALKISLRDYHALLIPLLVSKLDNKIIRDWETKIANLPKEVLPTYDELRKFLLLLAETTDIIKVSTHNTQNHGKPRISSHSSTINISCVHCKGAHFIHKCDKFLKIEPSERIKIVKTLQLCINCLRKGHFSKNCMSSKCKICGKDHNTLLHVINSQFKRNIENSNASLNNVSLSEKLQTVSNCSTKSCSNYQTLLPTAELYIVDVHGKRHLARALLDSASQSSFITRNFYDELKLPKHDTNIVVSGIGNGSSQVTHCTSIKIHSKYNNYSSELSCLIIDQITEYLPHISFSASVLSIPKHVKLADEHFNKSRQVDILLGANIFWNLILEDQINLGKNEPVIRNTKLGWVISGKFSALHSNVNVRSFANTSLDQTIQLLWKLDEFQTLKPCMSTDDKVCDDYFLETVRRDDTGRFIVKIPFNENFTNLGCSKEVATKRFYSLERRLQSNSHLRDMYISFIKEYINLQHMSKVTNSNIEQVRYFLPHHPVLKESSTTTKLRIVFDGSQCTDTGYSLNDVQSSGPSLQVNVFAILLRFRKHKFIATADIEKMFRQILIDPSQRQYQ